MSFLKEKLDDCIAKRQGQEPYVPWTTLWGRLGVFRFWRNLVESWAKRHPAPRIRQEGDLLRVEKGDLVVYWPEEYATQPLLAVWKETLLGHPHDYLRFYAPKQGDVVFDVGACEGFFGLRVVSSLEQLWLLEPVPRLVEALERTFSSWIAQGKVHVEAVALGRDSGRGRMEIARGSAVSGHLQEGPVEEDAPEEEGHCSVAVESLDGFVHRQRIRRLDLVKMDVEGAELQVLDGASETLRRLRPDLLVCAYHRGGDFEAIRSRLEPLGYSLSVSPVVHVASGDRPYYRYALVYATCRSR